MRLTDLPSPATSAAHAALEVASAYCSPALLNHSVRSYLWGAAYADQAGIEVDHELLYVAAVLHDLGLVATFDSHTVDFEYAGGHVAWAFTAGAGWPPARRARVAEVIVRHMWSEVDRAYDPEGHVLGVSTGMDISGRGVANLPAELRIEVLEHYPRLGLVAEFIACFADQAERKPAGTAAAAVHSGIAARITANPLDDVRPDLDHL